MRQTLILLSIVSFTIIGLALYCAALIDWVQDFKTGIYANDHIEATLETAAILFYTLGGLFFFRRRLAH